MEFCVVAGRDGPERHHRPGVGAAAEQSHPPQQRLPGNPVKGHRGHEDTEEIWKKVNLCFLFHSPSATRKLVQSGLLYV